MLAIDSAFHIGFDPKKMVAPEVRICHGDGIGTGYLVFISNTLPFRALS